MKEKNTDISKGRINALKGLVELMTKKSSDSSNNSNNGSSDDNPIIERDIDKELPHSFNPHNNKNGGPGGR